MLKTAVIEGSGITPSNTNDVFNVVTFNGTNSQDCSDIDLLHLTGTASLSSMLLNFVRTRIRPKYLPWTLFTSGILILILVSLYYGDFEFSSGPNYGQN